MKCKRIGLTAVLFAMMFASAVTAGCEATGIITDMNVFTDYNENLITVEVVTEAVPAYLNFTMLNDDADVSAADSIYALLIQTELFPAWITIPLV